MWGLRRGKEKSAGIGLWRKEWTSSGKHSFGEGANCEEKAWAQTGTSFLVKTAHRCLKFQIFSLWRIKWLHWRQGHTHMLITSCTDNWKCSVLMLQDLLLHLHLPPSPLSFLRYFTFPSVSARGWPTGGKWVTPLLSLDTIAFDTRWWEREQKGAHSTFSRIWAALAALKWMLPLMVKSIRDGDSVARLQTVTIADYNSTTPLPQHIPPPPPPPPNSPSLHCLFRWSVGTSEGFRGVGLEGEWGTLDRRGGFRVTKEKDLQWKRRGRDENRRIRRSWTHNAVSLFTENQEREKKEKEKDGAKHYSVMSESCFTQLLSFLHLLLLHFPSRCCTHALKHAYQHTHTNTHTEYFFFFFFSVGDLEGGGGRAGGFSRV